MKRDDAMLRALAGLVCLGLAACSLWVLFEQDIYWQIRAGDELWRTHSFPTQDSWSYSAIGQPWRNFQWLSTLLLRGLWGLGAEPALICGRAALVALWLMVAASTVLRAAPALPAWQRACMVVTLVPLVYVALWPRLQLRSDTFVMLTMAVLVRLWQAPLRDKTRAAVAVGSVVLAANLHAGTAPFAAVIAATLSVCTLPWRLATITVMGCILGLFVNPYGLEVVPLWLTHFFYNRNNLLPNSDHLPLSWHYFSPRGNGGAGIAWLALMALAAAGALRANVARPWPWRRWIGLATVLVFTAMAFNRVRAIPYLVTIVLPLCAVACAGRRGRWVLVGALPLGIGLAGVCVRSLSPIWGFGVHERLFPVGSTRFVAAMQPRPNIFHTFAYGAYLVWHLKEYQLYVDTRETMYWPLQAEVLAQYHSAEITQALLEKYHVNVVMMPIPPTRYVPDTGFEDVLARYMPDDSWALVYFDKISFVMVRRIPAHAAIIAEHAYSVLRPNLPGNVYPLSAGRTPERDAAFARDVARCRHDEPHSVVCAVAQAAWWRTTDAARHAAEAPALLEDAQRQHALWGSHQEMTLWVELQSAYRAAGRAADAARIERQLSGGMVVPR